MALILKIIEFDTKQIKFKDLKQLYPVAPLQDLIKQDPNSQLVINDLV
jgi:hypothetical protein